MADFDVTQDVIWVSNLVENRLHIDENVISKTEWGQFDELTYFLFSRSFFDVRCLGGPSRVLENGYHLSRIQSVNTAPVYISNKGGCFMIGEKKERVLEGAIDFRKFYFLDPN